MRLWRQARFNASRAARLQKLHRTGKGLQFHRENHRGSTRCRQHAVSAVVDFQRCFFAQSRGECAGSFGRAGTTTDAVDEGTKKIVNQRPASAKP
jgi:hypothetical protein